MREIYLDNNATTKIAPEVLETMRPYFDEFFGNPSSLHKKGIEAERALKESRRVLAGIFHVKEGDVFFTSGATESDNWALRGVAHALKNKGNKIVTTKVEHEAVLETCKQLEKEGFEVAYLDVDESGSVDVDNMLSEVDDKTIMVAVMHVNNELGTIYPINDLAKKAKDKKSDVVFFSDGVQAVGKTEINLENIDLYSISAHKIHGPKGSGALIAKEGVKLLPLLYGGGQESGMRSGTENVPGAVGLAKAVEISCENIEKNKEFAAVMKERFIRTLLDIEDVRINSPKNSVSSTVNAAFKGIPAEVLLHALEEEGVYASTGSACANNKQSTSHVLQAVNVPYEYINS
ncbi:MAG: cysteine desulfurase family protein, partial [Candidatus Spechtbacterales bacterium]